MPSLNVTDCVVTVLFVPTSLVLNVAVPLTFKVCVLIKPPVIVNVTAAVVVPS